MTFSYLSRITLIHFLLSHGIHLQLDGIIPCAIFVFRVKLHGLHVVSGDEVSRHVSLGYPDLSGLTLLDCPCKDLIFLGNVSEPMPSF